MGALTTADVREILKTVAGGDAPSMDMVGVNAAGQGEDWEQVEGRRTALAHVNAGFAALGHSDPRAALIAFEAALTTHASAEAWRGKGDCLRALQRFLDAQACYAQALARKPDDPVTLWHDGLVRLALGDFERGWALYEKRWDIFSRFKKVRPHPLWAGEPLAGKTILLTAEQGYGDTLQFCRSARDVKARGAIVILQVPPALRRLMRTLDGVDGVVGEDEDAPRADYYCPLLSLPRILGSVAFAASRKTYLRAVREDGPTLPEAAPHPRIGLCWSSNRAREREKWRSIPARDLAPLCERKAHVVSLQPRLHSEDIAAIGAQIHQFALTDFAATAALIDQLDLVITIDSAVAHLAGALGKPTWILLPFVNLCWRWGTDGETTPWYPSARLFRQREHETWADVVGRVCEELPACL